ncbi:polysaccharide deacetylase [Gemmatimonadetes bacterium T265]|nr:polysaccharide deacetylase [Gemmatimonadetes bacterium T265]
MLTDARPVASVSLDVDDLWTYLRTHGDPAWERRPSYLAAFVPAVLDALDEAGATITFFLVGEDAARDADAGRLRALAERGHEIANHTFGHDVWMQAYGEAAADEEIARAEAAIEAATGRRPAGFRGPGFSWGPPLLRVLARRGYRYDASTLPTFVGPLARRYFLATARLTPAERAERAALFGSFGDGLRPNRPYRWALGNGLELLELPVTTVPGARTPFHLSYLMYLAGYSERVMFGYLRGALALCRATGTEPSFLLHPLDLLGAGEAPGLEFFPGMALGAARKRRLFVRVLRVLGEHFALVPMAAHAERAGRGPLPRRAPDRESGGRPPSVAPAPLAPAPHQKPSHAS